MKSSELAHWRAAFRARAAALIVCTTAGCASIAHQDAAPQPPAYIDAQQDFARILCEVNDSRGANYADHRPCSQILAAGGGHAPVPGQRTPEPCCYTLVFVPGILGECVAQIATPFSDSYERLRAKGHDIVVVPVKGRASSAENAKLIAEHLGALELRFKVVIIGYSKGVTDSLEALILNHDAAWIGKVSALVSVAGVVAGTPIADRFAGLYERFFSKLPWPTCAPENGGGPRSLTRAERSGFLAEHKLPSSIKYYSLVATATPTDINPLLLPFYEALREYGPNDGQVVNVDAIIPGSYLLGVLRGDHWSVALPFNRSKSIEALPLRLANGFPREVLLDAVLAFVSLTADQ